MEVAKKDLKNIETPPVSNSYEVIERIIENIEKCIVGKTEAVKLALITLISKGHLLIEDVPGVGKTSLISSLASSINATFKRISFTPDVLPSDITGFSVYNRKTGEFEFRPGAVDCNFLLADEINRTSPKTQSSLLEAMQEGNVSVEGVTYKIEQPFMVMATQNPIEHLGTYPLPEAQLDRFFMKIQMGYPSNQDEAHIVKQQMNSHFIKQLKPVATKKDILRIQEEVSNVHIEDSLALYIVGVANETRNNQDILLGVSPRGSIALGRASQAFAYLAGRNYVLPEDVKSAAIPVLRHRIILNKEAKIRRVQPEEVIESILSKVNIGM